MCHVQFILRYSSNKINLLEKIQVQNKSKIVSIHVKCLFFSTIHKNKMFIYYVMLKIIL